MLPEVMQQLHKPKQTAVNQTKTTKQIPDITFECYTLFCLQVDAVIILSNRPL